MRDRNTVMGVFKRVPVRRDSQVQREFFIVSFPLSESTAVSMPMFLRFRPNDE